MRISDWSSDVCSSDLVTTGKPAWHFQTVHKDVWDYDLGSTATLVDFPTADGIVPALILPSKQGDLYVLDRRTGKPLTEVVERRSEERRGGKEGVSKCRSRWSQSH